MLLRCFGHILTVTVRLALEMASKKDVSLPTSTAANKTYLEALQKGLGDEDFCAVYKAL